jgi:hypothetical protein
MRPVFEFVADLARRARARHPAGLAGWLPTRWHRHAPSDWRRIRLTKDFESRYLFGPPGEDVAPRLFGLPVVPTQAIVADKFVVGSFQAAGTIYDR